MTTFFNLDVDTKGWARHIIVDSWSIGQAAVPALISLLAGADFKSRKKIAFLLGSIGLPALSLLTEGFKDAAADVRAGIAYAIGRMQLDTDEAVPTLLSGLNDSDWDVRRSCAYSLGRIGAVASSAIPALISCLEDSEWEVRRNAAQALGDIRSTTPSVLRALVKALSDKERRVRESVPIL